MEDKYWSNFESSGKIEDYLRYKGIQNIDEKTYNKLKQGLVKIKELING